MAEINTEIYRKVCEEGTLKTKSGMSVNTKHALDVLRAALYLCTNEKFEAISELLDLGESAQVSDETIEALGSSAVLVLSSDGNMLPETSQVLLDVVSVPVVESYIGFNFDGSHYTQQVEKNAENEGVTVTWGRQAFSPKLV